MQIETNMEGENEMVVKRLSVPLGLEELMESLTKEVLRRRPADVYAFASEHFAQLLSLRDTGCYKTSFMKIKKTPSQISAESLDETRGTKTQAPIKIKSAMLGTMTKIPRRKSPAPKSFIGSNPKRVQSNQDASVSPRSKSIILEESPTLKSDRARQILDKHMAKKQGDPKKVKMVTPQNDLDVVEHRKSATGNKTKQIKSLRSGEKKSRAKNDRTPGKPPQAAGEGPKDHEDETPKGKKESDESKDSAALPKTETATKEELKPTEELKKEDLKQEMQNNSASKEKTKEEIIEQNENSVVERKLSKGETFDKKNALSMTSETENQKDNAVLNEERRAKVIEDDTKAVTSEAAEIKNNLNSRGYERIVEEEANKDDGQIKTEKLSREQREGGGKEEITSTKTERESENESKVITGEIENDFKSTVDNSSKMSDASSEEMPITSKAAEIKSNLNSKEHEKIIEEGTNKDDGQIDTEKLLPEQKSTQREDGGKEEMTLTKTEMESEKRESDLKSTVDSSSKISDASEEMPIEEKQTADVITGKASEESVEKLENAAVKIQASFRGYQSRKKLGEKTNPKPQNLLNAIEEEENFQAQSEEPDILAQRESAPITKEEVIVKTVEQTELAPETSNDLENEIVSSDKNDTGVKKEELERKNVTLEAPESPAMDGPFKEEKGSKDVNPKPNRALAAENIAQEDDQKIKENLRNDEEPDDLLTRSTNAAVKIQAYVRGHLARQKSIYRNNSDLNLTKSEETDVTNDENNNNNDKRKPIVHPPKADDNTDSKKIGPETSESFRKTFVETISENDQDETQPVLETFNRAKAKELTKAFVEYEQQNYQADNTVQFKSIKNGNEAPDAKELSQEKMISDGHPKSVESILQEDGGKAEATAKKLITPELSQEKANGLKTNSECGDGKEIGNSKSAEKVSDGGKTDAVAEKLKTPKLSKEDGLEISVGESKVEESKPVFDDSMKANSSTTVEDLPSNVEDAAVKIQSLWRGHKMRKHIKNVELKDLQKPTECDELPGDRLSVEDLIKAATLIQALFRGYTVRKHFVIGTMDKSFRKGKSFDEKLPTVLEVEDDDNEDGPKMKANEGNFENLASTEVPNEEKEDLVTRKEDDEKISSAKGSDEEENREERSEEVKKLDNEEVPAALKQLEHVSIPPKTPEIIECDQIHSGGEIASNIHEDLAEIANSIKEDVVKLKQVLGDDTVTKNEDGREEKRRREEEEDKKDGDTNEGDAHLLDLASSMKEDAQKLRETLSNEAKMKDEDELNGKETTNEVDPENMSRPVSKESTTSADSMDTVIFNDQRPRGKPIRADTVLPENYIQDNLETSMQNLSMDQFDDLSSGSIDDKHIINVEDDGFTSQTHPQESPVKHEVKFRILGELKEDSGEDDSGSASEREKRLGEVKEQSSDLVTDVIDTAAKKIQKFFKQNRGKKGKRSTAEVLKQIDSVQSQSSLNSSEDATATGEDKSGETDKGVAATTIQKTYRGYRVRRDLQNRNRDDAEYDKKEKDIDKEITNLLKSITEPVRRAFSADKNKVETDEKVEVKQSTDEPNSVYIPLRDYSSEERADSEELVVPSKSRAGSKVDIYLPLFNRESASGDADNSVSSTSTSKTLTTGEYSAEDISDSCKSIENKLEFEQKHAASADGENSVNGLNVEEDAEQNRSGTTPKVEDHKDTTKQQRIEDNTEMGKQEEIRKVELEERKEKTKIQKSEEKNQSNEETANTAITQYINSLIEPIKQAFSADKNRADKKTDKVADVQTSVKDEGPIYIPLRDYSEENLQQSGPGELGFRSDRKKRGALDDDPETTLDETGQKIVKGSKGDEKHEPTSTGAPDLPSLELKPEETFGGMKKENVDSKEFKKPGNLNELEAQILDELGLTEGESERKKSGSDLGRKTKDFGSRHSALVKNIDRLEETQEVHEAKTGLQNSEDAKNGSKTENFPDNQEARELNGIERKKEIESTTEFQGQIDDSLAQTSQNSEAGEEMIKTEDLQTAPTTGDIEKEDLSQISPDETSPKKMADISQIVDVGADNSSTVSNGKRLEENIVRKDKTNEETGVKQEEKSFENKHTDQVEKENVNNILNEINALKDEERRRNLSLKQSSEETEMEEVIEKFEERKDQKKVASNSAMELPNKMDQDVTDFTPKESAEEEKREKIGREDSQKENANEEVTDVRTKDEEQSTGIKGGGGEEKRTKLIPIAGENVEILKAVKEDQLEIKQGYALEDATKSDDEKSNSKTQTNGESQSEKVNDFSAVQKNKGVAAVQKKLDPHTPSDIAIDESKVEREIIDSQQLKSVETVANESTGTGVKEISQEKVVTVPSVPLSEDEASEIPKGDGEEAIAKLESQIIPVDDVKSEGKDQDVIGISGAESQRREDLAVSVGGSEKPNVMRNQESLIESDEKGRPSKLNGTTKTEKLSSENDIPQKEEVTSAKPEVIIMPANEQVHRVSTAKSTEFETSISNQEESDLETVSSDGKCSETAKLQDTNAMIEEEKSKSLSESEENTLPHVEESEGSLKAIESQGLNAENSQKNIVYEGGPTLSENEDVHKEDAIIKPEDVNLAADGVKEDMKTDEDKLRDVGKMNDENSKLVGTVAEDVQATVERTKTIEEDNQRSKIEESDGKVTIKNDDATAEVDVKYDEDLKGVFVQNIANKEETFDVTSEKQNIGDGKFDAKYDVENIQAKAVQESNKQSSEVQESDETTGVKEDDAAPTHKGEDIIRNVGSEKNEAAGQIMEDTEEFGQKDIKKIDQKDDKKFDQKKNNDQLLLEDVKKQSIDEATSVKPADECAMAEASQSIDDKQQMSYADNDKHLGDIKEEENQKMIEKYTNDEQVRKDVDKKIEKENFAQAKTRPISSKAGEEIEEAKIDVPDVNAKVDDLEEIPQIPVAKKEGSVSSSNVTHTIASELEEESRTPIVTSESRDTYRLSKEENGKRNEKGEQRSEDVISRIDNSEGETNIKEENSNVGKTDETVKEESKNERGAESKEEESIPTLDITKEESKIPQIPVTQSHTELKKEESASSSSNITNTTASQSITPAESRDTYELSKDENGRQNEKDKLRSAVVISQIDNSEGETNIKEENSNVGKAEETVKEESKNERDAESKEEESIPTLDITKEESKIPQIPVTQSHTELKKEERASSSSNITNTTAPQFAEENGTAITASESRDTYESSKDENGRQNEKDKLRSENEITQIDDSKTETDIKEENLVSLVSVGKTDESKNEQDTVSKEEESLPTLDITKEEGKKEASTTPMENRIIEKTQENKQKETTPVASSKIEVHVKDDILDGNFKVEGEIVDKETSKPDPKIEPNKEENAASDELVKEEDKHQSNGEDQKEIIQATKTANGDTESKEEESIPTLDITKEEGKKEASTTPMEDRIIEKTQENKQKETAPVASSKIEVHVKDDVLDGKLKVEEEIAVKETSKPDPKIEPNKEENSASDELVKEEDKHQSNGEDQKEIIQVTKSTNEEAKEENEDVVDSLDGGTKSAEKPQSDSDVFNDGKVKSSSSSVTSDFGPESILQVEANKSAPFYLHQESYGKSPTTSQEKAFAEALKQDFETKTKVEDGERLLLHSSEFHDSIPLNVPSEKKKDEADPAAGPQFLTHSSELHDSIIPLVLQMNDAPAGTETVTSGRKASVSVGAQASDKDASAAREDAPDNAQHSRRSFGTDMEKRNNSAIVRKSMEVEAATKIQASFRGYQVRKQLKNRKTGGAISSNRRSSRRKSSGRISDSKRASLQNKNPSQLEQESATKIQAGIRGFLVRRRQKKEKTNKTPESG